MIKDFFFWTAYKKKKHVFYEKDNQPGGRTAWW
jgi:hypothetical protein